MTEDLKTRMTGGDGAGAIVGLPHAKALNMRVVATAQDMATLAIPYDSRLIGDPATGVIHGGAVTTLLDTCCGLAVLMSGKAPAATATLDLRIDYMRPAAPGREIFATAQCHRTTRSVAFVRAAAYHDDPDQPIATASAAFMLQGG